MQREALQQRQAELRSVDQRILELQNRLHKKKASNLILQTQQLQPQHQQQHSILNNNIAFQLLSNTTSVKYVNRIFFSVFLDVKLSHAFLIGRHFLLPFVPLRPSNSVYPSQRVIPRGNNVAAVEPYVHTPQKTTVTPSVNQHQQLKKQQQQQQYLHQSSGIHHDLSSLKLNLQSANTNINVNHLTFAESDETKLARQKLHTKQNSDDFDNDADGKTDSKFQTLPYSNKFGLTKSASSGAIPYSSANRSGAGNDSSDGERTIDSDSTTSKSGGHQQLTVHSTPLSTINKGLAVAVSASATAAKCNQADDRPQIKPKAKQQKLPSGNLVVPPRKPISSVAPTTVTMAPKIVAHSPKVHVVAPNINTASIVSHMETDKSRPALPPKPAKSLDGVPADGSPSATAATASTTLNSVSSVPTVVSVINKPPMSEPSLSSAPLHGTTQPSHTNDNQSPIAFPPATDNLPIKAKPLTIKKQPLSEQPRLRSMNIGVKPMQYSSRRIEMPPAFLFPEIEKGSLKDKSGSQSPNSNSTVDETDKSTASSTNGDDTGGPHSAVDVVKRMRSSMNEHGKTKLARRVSFDPLALLLDASLEGELELVRKTTMQVCVFQFGC